MVDVGTATETYTTSTSLEVGSPASHWRGHQPNLSPAVRIATFHIAIKIIHQQKTMSTQANTVKKYLSGLGKKGGAKTKNKYGKKHYTMMGKLSAEAKRNKRLVNQEK